MTAPSATPRIMAVGCGAVTERLFLPALAALRLVPGVLVDTNLARAQELAGSSGAGEVSTDWASVARGGDAAFVGLPHALHAPVCIDLLQRGVHVLVEKPMALSAAECDAMIAAGRASGAVLAVGMTRRFLWGGRWVKAALDAGVLGNIESVDVREGFPYGWPVASDFFFRKEAAGGGVLIDTGAHTLDQLSWWFGEAIPKRYRDDSHGGVEADCELTLELAMGAEATVELSRTRELRNTAVVRGALGELEISLHDNHLQGRPRRLLRFRHGGWRGGALPSQGFGAPFVDEVRNWLDAIAGRATVAVDGAEARRSVALIERCYAIREPLNLPWFRPVSSARVTSPSENVARLHPSRSLVTGATGFIGGRLVETLALGAHSRVRALVRRFSRASRIARFPVEMIPGSVADPVAVDRAVAGCDVVYHCAYDFAEPNRNLEAAKALADACLHHRVRRLVHVSSFSVYEPLSDGDVMETAAWPPCDQRYALNKREAEESLLSRARQAGLPVVILQPTVVYGAFSEPWTLDPVRMMRSGRIVLPDAGDGLCNAVYVDDVVNAMLLAADADVPPGERFLVSAAEPVTWLQFYRAFGSMLGLDGVVCLPAGEITRRASLGTSADLRSLARDPRTVTRWRVARTVADTVRRTVGEARWQRFKGWTPPPMHLPLGPRLEFFHAKPWVRIDKARAGLGYSPAFDFEAGMARTADFVRWARL